jgi:transcriptional regulator with XRE-family HTH domain
LKVRTFRIHSADAGHDRALYLARRFGTELRIARTSAGLTQRQLALRSRVSQQEVSRAERGDVGISLEARSRMAAGAGHELGLRLYPATSVPLRDSGQLRIAEVIAGALHESWSGRLEVPVAPGDLRAADLLLTRSDEVVEVEVERSLVDFQAQLRAAQIKRQVLAERLDKPVRLVIAVPDSSAIRARLSMFSELLDQALPVRSREIATALRVGRPIGGDGLLFVRVARLTTAARAR